MSVCWPTPDPEYCAPEVLTHLIIVCGHAIHLGGWTNGEDEEEWAIEPFQRGEATTFVNHIRAGAQALQDQKNSLLVFSGGATKKSITKFTEGGSYSVRSSGIPVLKPHSLSNASVSLIQCLPNRSHLIQDIAYRLFPWLKSHRTAIEPYATDSYQNLLFSICGFRHFTGHYPSHITVVSHAFKEFRFQACHCGAIRWPLDKFTFIGIDPPDTPREVLDEGEKERGWGPFSKDMYGVGPALEGKRMVRGWNWHRVEEVKAGCEKEVERLLRWKGGESGNNIFPGDLPWDRRISGTQNSASQEIDGITGIEQRS